MSDDSLPEVVCEYTNLLIHNIPEYIPGTASVLEKFPELVEILNVKPNVPFMIYCGNGSIKSLNNFTHSIDVILNELDVYLFEPMCSYRSDDPTFNAGFYNEFEELTDYDTLRSLELDSILYYAKNNNIPNVRVHTCSYRVEQCYPYYKSHLQLLCNDAFVKCLTLYDHNDQSPKTSFNKTFISTSWRFTPSRLLTSAYLSPFKSNIVWYFKTDPNILPQVPWLKDVFTKPEKFLNIRKAIEQDLAVLNDNSPKYLDLVANSATEINYYSISDYPTNVKGYGVGLNPAATNNTTLSLENYYRETFVDIVNESRFAEPTGVISEKVLQSVQFLTPFVLIAPPKTLEYLKTFGFKTFANWWDESYDDCEHHATRLEMIFELINYINSRSHSQLMAIYYEMLPTLQHNLEIAIPLTRYKRLMPYQPAQNKTVIWTTTETTKADIKVY